ncbi:nucleotidyltransferase [Alkalicoccus daliensis]|uniref:tRNA(Met) cytidine acetate ligase n=1 Tax=Alkalicoccus daliensis TaxID=745820 RepID=A0A1G9ZV64_9BACI|nr:nucleotidyltransferase [Alkalicoccus daliensis]SDN24563.1 Predicted nucleotidyltransferase [Alkalicoccus daliensis]
MRVLGLIVEYNPFHNGHKLHLDESIKKCGADITIAVMSGSFLQRGEPALVDKWTRTQMALAQGVDLVIELPYQYAVQKAEIFAQGAVASLHEMGATHICFGSEAGEIQPFYTTMDWMRMHKSKLDIKIKEHSASGKSYPRSFSEAFSELNNEPGAVDLSKPNNILGYHYTIEAEKHGIHSATIQRTGAGHNEYFPNYTAKIASATSLRNLIGDTGVSSIKNFVPEKTFQLLVDYQKNNRMFHTWENYYPFLQYKLLTMTPDTLKTIYECDEGLENRLLRFKYMPTFSSFIDAVKTKRYTRTRLQRLCVHILTNSEKKTIRELAWKDPDFIRVLGINNSGRTHLNKIKKKLSVPLITKVKDSAGTSYIYSSSAADIHSHILPAESRKFDYEHPIIIE